MAREILFRGKRKANGKWIEGGVRNRFTALFGEERYIIHCEDEYNVIPETVSEYTGLTDINGAKIFEGDIVKHLWSKNGKFKQYETFVITYEKGSYYICPVNKSETVWKVHIPDSDMEVIGNIWDNPELMKGE